MKTAYIITGIIILTLTIIIISLYNKLNATRNQIHNAQSSLDALFIKRHDLIPNLITVIKQYVDYEKGILEKITELRSEKSKINEYEKDGELSAIIKNIMIQIENYPVLKASEQFSRLQYNWTEIEEDISAGRRYLSASITDYNNRVKTFPSNILAAIFGFKPYAWERATDEQRKKINAKDLF